MIYDPMLDRRCCRRCGRTGGLLLCNGCQFHYCPKHVRVHRQALSDQLEDVMKCYNSLQKDISESSDDYINYKKIDRWENESIRIIQSAAANARQNLREINERSKKQLKTLSRNIGMELVSSWKTDEFEERDLKRWMNQINELRVQIKSTFSCDFIETKQNPIYLIAVANHSTSRKYSYTNKSIISRSQQDEHFLDPPESILLEDNCRIIRHLGPDFEYGHIRGKTLYSNGRHTIHFKLLQCQTPYSIFLGCISSAITHEPTSYKSKAAFGWFGYNEIYQHGVWSNKKNLHGYKSNEIRENDVMNLIIDCEAKQIELVHERTKKTHKLDVNIDEAPFPWQILVVLTRENDAIEILP